MARLGVTARNGAANGIATTMNTGTIEIYTGSSPAAITGTPAGTLLGVCTFASSAFASASNGTIVANSITADSNANANGTAGFFRIRNAADNATLLDGTCGQGSGDLSFDNTTIVSGGTIDITGFSLTVPE